ncbi:MAG: HAD family hydrolase [Blautia sp.]|nr:HAD family phosphatase [Blautia sp.]MDD7371921.1 HAD family phosphatase [Bacillota bacterium]MDY3716264.1 HAD family phosphatase [Blautia sp.]
MKKLKQILAITGIIVLLGIYVLAFVFALIKSPGAESMLMAALYSTVIVPVLLYAILLVYKWTKETDGIEKIDSEKAAVNTIIFDLGKVLVDYDWKKYLKSLHYDEASIQAVGDAMFASKDWVEADRGVRNEEEILQSFIDNDPEYEKEIRNAFEDMGFTIHTFSYTRIWLKYLKKRGYKIYYLSNFSKPLYDRCKEELSFLDLMDGGYMSWQVKMLKPEPEFYQKLLKDFKIDPAKAVFLDDVLDNIAEARIQGINAVHFKGKKEAVQTLQEEFGVS